jgi:hypothetical protein
VLIRQKTPVAIYPPAGGAETPTRAVQGHGVVAGEELVGGKLDLARGSEELSEMPPTSRGGAAAGGRAKVMAIQDAHFCRALGPWGSIHRRRNVGVGTYRCSGTSKKNEKTWRARRGRRACNIRGLPNALGCW